MLVTREWKCRTALPTLKGLNAIGFHTVPLSWGHSTSGMPRTGMKAILARHGRLKSEQRCQIMTASETRAQSPTSNEANCDTQFAIWLRSMWGEW